MWWDLVGWWQTNLETVRVRIHDAFQCDHPLWNFQYGFQHRTRDLPNCCLCEWNNFDFKHLATPHLDMMTCGPTTCGMDACLLRRSSASKPFAAIARSRDVRLADDQKPFSSSNLFCAACNASRNSMIPLSALAFSARDICSALFAIFNSNLWSLPATRHFDCRWPWPPYVFNLFLCSLQNIAQLRDITISFGRAGTGRSKQVNEPTFWYKLHLHLNFMATNIWFDLI